MNTVNVIYFSSNYCNKAKWLVLKRKLFGMFKFTGGGKRKTKDVDGKHSGLSTRSHRSM